MKKGKCPKCGASDVRRGPKAGAWTTEGRIPAGGFLDAGVPVQYYVCAVCGYVEGYVNDPKPREKLRQEWPLATERE